MAEEATLFPVRVLAVIVLYKMTPQSSVSFQTLNAAINRTSSRKISLKIFFYDNTPGGQASATYPEESIYEANGENRGVAVAYNRATEIAHREGFDWLLTLDQDTKLPIDFLDKLADTVVVATPLKNVGAIAPLLYDKTTLISPIAGTRTVFRKNFSEAFIGISKEKATWALNSASTVRVSALISIGGYDSRFWLDYSDAVMFHRLESHDLRVFVAGNIRVEHELSVMDMKHRMQPARYEAILGAESAYCDEYMGRTADLQLLVKLTYRLFYKFGGRGGNLAYSKIAGRFLYRRLFYSRKHRMEIWENSVQSRLDKSRM